MKKDPFYRVLIISYTFPPKSGIGGRRWVKFARVLKEKGHLVKVIAAAPKSGEISLWNNDAEILSGDITYLPSGYPSSLDTQPKSFLQKLLYRASLLFVRLSTSGNYYDRSVYWRSRLLKKASEIIGNFGIQNMICTVGPFRQAETLLHLKSRFANLNMLVDYRDPWTNNRTSFGYDRLSPRRFRVETAAEHAVLSRYDRITCVSEGMFAHFARLAGNDILSKLVYLPNGFDKRDFKNVGKAELPGKGAVKVVYGGTFYARAAHIIERIARSLTGSPTEGQGSINFIFVGLITDEIRRYFREFPNLFYHAGQKSLQETYGYISAADYGALFLTDDLDHSFSTKFYEYIALRKPILSFSREMGETGKFIESNGLGHAVTFENMDAKLAGIVQAAPPGVEHRSDLDKFEVAAIEESLEMLLTPDQLT